ILPGSDEQKAEIRQIFAKFIQGSTQADIIRDLNRRGVLSRNGRPWNSNMMGALLRNEAYIGNMVWNRISDRLGGKRTYNPKEQWIRNEGCIEPIVDRETFRQANKILNESRVYLSEEEMLRRLRKVLAKEGSLNMKIINSAPGLPSSSTYAKHFA